MADDNHGSKIVVVPLSTGGPPITTCRSWWQPRRQNMWIRPIAVLPLLCSLGLDAWAAPGVASIDTGYTISKVRTALRDGASYIVASSYEGTVLGISNLSGRQPTATSKRASRDAAGSPACALASGSTAMAGIGTRSIPT